MRVVNFLGKSSALALGLGCTLITLSAPAHAKAPANARPSAEETPPTGAPIEPAKSDLVPGALSAETFYRAANGAVAGNATSQQPIPDEPVSVPAQATTASAPRTLDLKLVTSQFVDAPISGDAPDTVRYGGRVDGYFAVNATSHFKINLRPEFVWGETSNGEVGLIPGNSALFRSEGNGDFDLAASLQYTWDSGATLEVGKMNLLDTGMTIPILQSNGHFGFQSLGLTLPPTGIAPNTVTGAMLTVPTEKMLYRVWVIDPDSQFERTGFETAFESGVALLVAAARRIKVAGQPGVVNLALVGSTRSSLAKDILPTALTPPPTSAFGTGRGEYAVQLSAYQYLQTYVEAPGKGWGILARFQASAGDPTFLDYSGYIGVSGNPRWRPQDRFGLAYFHYSLTNELVRDIAFRLPIEDEDGVEAFYTYQFDDRFGLSANVQVVDSAVAFRDVGLTVGMRLTAAF